MDPFLQSSDQPVDLTGHITRTSDYSTAVGGFGDVWRCMLQTGSNQIVVAVKVIRLQDGGVDEKALRRELGTWKRLQHTNIVPLLGIARDFGPCMSMVSPWFENGSLTLYLRKYNDITLLNRLRLLEDISSGLHYLHGVSVVHGDLTPSNVLLNDEKRAVLTDFGLSSMLAVQGHSYLQRSCAQPGAIRYSAPELLRLDASLQPDTRSDVYSFGCLALRILSGYEPWPDVKHERNIIFKVGNGETPKRPVDSQISDSHWHLIEQCFSPLGATPPRPSTCVILTFLENEIQSEVAILSTGLSNRDEATSSFQDNISVSTLPSTGVLETSSTVDTEQPITTPSCNLPSSVRANGKGPAKSSPKTRKLISNLFHRKSVQSENKIEAHGASVEREATSKFVIPTKSLTRVQSFAVPPGGLGNTFQCELRISAFKKEKVAVKSIKALRNGDEKSIRSAQKTILAEVKHWMSLQHDNILPIYGTTTEFGSNLPCLVSPWMENGSLTSYLSARSQTLSSAEKFTLLSHVAAGLHYLHCNGVVHGNLSSNNVLIDRSHKVRLADYGLSSVISACGDLCGALRWIAPELISDNDENQVSSRYSDIYSFGCIALHVLSGKLPYWWLDDVFCVIYARHRGEDPLGPGTQIDGAYVLFVRQCLSTIPTDRPTLDEIKFFVAKSMSD